MELQWVGGFAQNRIIPYPVPRYSGAPEDLREFINAEEVESVHLNLLVIRPFKLESKVR